MIQNEAQLHFQQLPRSQGVDLRIVEVTVDAQSIINVATIVTKDLPIDYLVLEDTDYRPVEILTNERLLPCGVNLIATDEGVKGTLHANGLDAPLFGESQHEKWRLQDAQTYFLMSAAENEAKYGTPRFELLSPITDAPVEVAAGQAYRFSILLGVHRCTASVLVETRDAHGALLRSDIAETKLRRLGGASVLDYERVEIVVAIPPGGATLRLLLGKSVTLRKEDSYVFFCNASLLLLDPDALERTEVTTLSRSLLQRITGGGLELVQTKLRLIEPPTRRESFQFTLAVVSGDLRATVDCLLPVEPVPFQTTDLKVSNGDVHIVGIATQTAGAAFDIGVFVDATLAVTVQVPVHNTHFDAWVHIPASYLDGAPHAIEVRVLPQHTSLGTTYAILPFAITPWSAVQKYAGPPMDITGSPAAGYHMLSMRAWLDAAQRPGAVLPAQLSILHDELVGGFRKRAAYRPLTFVVQPSPEVSIVIPVHNKFEITYFCLCSLLFAYTNATFEVIVVDDGSSDATLQIDTVVSGIKVVRHEVAMGFVQSCNDGAALATGRHIAFLNNDTEVTVGWLDELLDAIQNFENVGLVGARLLYPDGKLQEAGGIVWASGNPWNVGRNGNAMEPQFNYLRQVDYLSGAAILLPRSVWDQVGGFSSDFAPAYFEDTDLAMKVRDAGLHVLYVPAATIFHFEGQSAGTSTASGMKRFQEINRPKFKKRWYRRYASHGVEGVQPEREKDRGAAFRVLFLDHRFPLVDSDAGSYAAFQEIRLLQAMGAKVTFLPRNLAWMDRHTLALQRIGVECLYAPFVMNFAHYIRDHTADFDVIYVTRFKVAEHVIEALANVQQRPRIVFNLADLHFLRELREAAIVGTNNAFESARATRTAELAMVNAVDLTLSYSDVEIAVLQSHLDQPQKLARLPWVVDLPVVQPRRFEETKDLLFLGGFAHPPNTAAMKFFVHRVMPILQERCPGIRLRIVGSNPGEEIKALASDYVVVEGSVVELDEVFEATRVFVVPLLSGAGIKGKVLEAMSRGSSIVLSDVAAEATGLSHGQDCLIANNAAEWAAAVERVYTDAQLWKQLGANARKLAERRFSFEAGLELMRDALAAVDVYGGDGLRFRRARPVRYGRLPRGSSHPEAPMTAR